MVPRSVSEVCAPSLLLALCRSSTFCATTSPLKFCHGPRPMRSRALTAWAPPTPWVERYARQVLLPAPAPCASCWQRASAPASPPRSAPLPEPALVTKNVMLGDCGACCACALALSPSVTSATEPNSLNVLVFMFSPPGYGRPAAGHEPHPIKCRFGQQDDISRDISGTGMSIARHPISTQSEKSARRSLLCSMGSQPVLY